jgi:hypothetical protein
MASSVDIPNEGISEVMTPPRRRRSRIRRSLDQIKAATELALKHREEIEKGHFSPFIPALTMAIVKDGLLDMIPIIGNLFGLFIAVYLFIFLWGRGKWKVRLVIFFLSLFDMIPAVNLIPFSTICVLYAYSQARGHAREAEKKLSELNVLMGK